VTLLARLALTALCFDGRLVTFAWILLGAAFAALPVHVLLLVRGLGLSPGTLMRTAARSLLPCLAAVGTAALLRDAPLAGLAAAVVAWLVALRLVRHALWDELHQLLRLRSTIRK
jgi:hypothetical protein